MRVATWNVNGIRARETQLFDWLGREAPDIVCLQEIKAEITQLPLAWGVLASYDTYFHGSGGGYSGVSLHVKKSLGLGAAKFSIPSFDMETRVVVAEVGDLSVASVYVPNGGKDYRAKITFFRAMIDWAKSTLAGGQRLVIAGDLNIAHRDADVHETERKPRAVGQRAEERELMSALLGVGLVDVARKLHPEATDLYTWWPYWREARQKNIGWRIDYVLTSAELAERATACVSQRDFGSSDHAPVIADFAGSAQR